DERLRIPADAPQRIGRGIFVAENSARPGHVGELVASDERPLVRLAVPLRERATRRRGILQRRRSVVAVVRIHEPALPGIEALAVIARQIRVPALLALLVGPQF